MFPYGTDPLFGLLFPKQFVDPGSACDTNDVMGSLTILRPFLDTSLRPSKCSCRQIYKSRSLGPWEAVFLCPSFTSSTSQPQINSLNYQHTTFQLSIMDPTQQNMQAPGAAPKEDYVDKGKFLAIQMYQYTQEEPKVDNNIFL